MNGVQTIGGVTGGRPIGLFGVAVEPSGDMLYRIGAGSGSGLFRANAAGTTSAALGNIITNGAPVDPATVSLADGRSLALVNFLLSPPGVARYLASGAIDTSFGTNGVASLSGFAQPTAGPILQPDGRMLVAGTLNGAAAIVRFNSDGTPDTSFGAGGAVSNTAAGGSYRSIALQGDGHILAVSSGVLSRHDPNGVLDQSFGVGGMASLAQLVVAQQVRLQPSGKILVAGTIAPGVPNSSGYPASPDDIRLARFVQSGALDTTVGNGRGYRDLSSIGSTVRSGYSPHLPLIVMPDGRPLVIGQALTFGAFGGFTVGVMSLFPVDLGGESIYLLDFVPTAAHVLQSGRLIVGEHVTGQGGGVIRRLLGESDPSNCGTPVSTSTALSLSRTVSDPGQAVTLTATVAASSGTATPEGWVLFRDGSTNLGAPVPIINGVATLTTSALAEGSHSLTAIYSGQSGVFLTSTSPAVNHSVSGWLTINDPTANSAQGDTVLGFTVTLSAASGQPVTVAYATADRTARAGSDYTATSGTLTFNPGQTTRTIDVQVQGKTSPSPSKDFFVTLTTPTNASITKGAGIGTITYATSGSLSIYVDDPRVAEGYAGVTLLGFTVSLSSPPTSTVSVDYLAADGTALGGVDFTSQSGTLTFRPGQTQRWVVVPIAANATVGSNRTFFLNLTNAVGATIAKGQGTGTILDDDPTPAAATVAQYRLYSEITKEHLYTTDANEYAVLGTRSWNQEGTAYTMFKDGGSHAGQFAIPLYRMYHGGILQHHWTTDAYEVMVLAALGTWDYEGIAGYVLPATATGATPLYRLSLASPPLHIWTTDLHEKNVLSTLRGWVYEGIVGYVIP